MYVQLRKPFFPKESIFRIQKQIKKILNTGQLTLGKNVLQFEKNFANYFSMKYAVAVSSATAGLHLSLLALNIKKFDEIIVPAKTFISTANAALYCNAKPIFSDVNENSFQIEPDEIEKMITKKTKVIIPVHLGGNVCDMSKINKIAKKNNLFIIEDAAHAHGSTYDGKYAGTLGDMGVFSFYPDKIMGSSDGGIIVTNNRNFYNKLLLLRNVGRKSIGQYNYTEIGYNYRMNEIQAVIANEQLRLLPSMIKRRREIASLYNKEFSKFSNIQIQEISKNVNSSYYAFILKVKNRNLNKLRKNLQNNRIETSPMFYTVYKTQAYRNLGINFHVCKNSEKLDKQTFSIPLHPGLTNKQIDFVIKTIKKHIE